MKELWNKLEDFEVGTGDEEFTFVTRLARENDWSLSIAKQVFREYLKFVCLAATSERPVTPSDAVDQVWHLHLCYTESYWKELCRDALGRDLHHGPTKGGTRENTRYREQYEATLRLYADRFGEDPPADIWPSTERRFDRRDRFVRVNLRESFVVARKVPPMVFGAIVAIYFLSGCGQFVADAINGDPVNIFLLVVGLMLVIWVLSKFSGKGGGNGGGGCGGSSGCAGGSGCGGGGCGSGCGGGGCGS